MGLDGSSVSRQPTVSLPVELSLESKLHSQPPTQVVLGTTARNMSKLAKWRAKTLMVKLWTNLSRNTTRNTLQLLSVIPSEIPSRTPLAHQSTFSSSFQPFAHLSLDPPSPPMEDLLPTVRNETLHPLENLDCVDTLFTSSDHLFALFEALT